MVATVVRGAALVWWGGGASARVLPPFCEGAGGSPAERTPVVRLGEPADVSQRGALGGGAVGDSPAGAGGILRVLCAESRLGGRKKTVTVTSCRAGRHADVGGGPVAPARGRAAAAAVVGSRGAHPPTGAGGPPPGARGRRPPGGRRGPPPASVGGGRAAHRRAGGGGTVAATVHGGGEREDGDHGPRRGAGRGS